MLTLNDAQRKMLALLAKTIPAKTSVSERAKAVTISHDESGIFAEAWGGIMAARMTIGLSSDVDIPPATVNGSRLAAVLEKMSGDVTLAPKDDALSITSENGAVQLEYIPDRVELPEIDAESIRVAATVNSDLLFSVIKGLSQFCAKNDSMGALECIYWNPQTGDIAATDTHTLASARVSGDVRCNVEKYAGALVHPNFFRVASQFLSGNVSVAISDNAVRFGDAGFFIQHGLYEGQFPRFREIADSLILPNTIACNAAELRTALDFIRAARSPADVSDGVRLESDGVVMHMTEAYGHEKRAAKTYVGIDAVEGGNLHITLKGEYIKRCAMGDGNVMLDFKDANSPVRIKNNSGADTDCIECIVSPIYPKN